MLTKLSSSLDVELHTVVASVQTLEDGQMCLVDSKGREWVANKVRWGGAEGGSRRGSIVKGCVGREWRG